jgi:UDP:flavonoid glycosyltransferase YjiC (YdhE family)
MLMGFWDGGRCHLTRTLAMAEEAHNRGIEVGVITSEKYASELGSLASINQLYVIPTRPLNTSPPPYEFPLYSHAFRHAQRLRGLHFDDVRWLDEITQQEIEVIEDFRPDVVVNDYRDTIRTSAQVKGVPVAGITHTTGNINGLTFGWWTEPPADTIIPDCRDSFNEVRTSYGLDPITDEREMFSGDINLIPSTPTLDPLAKKTDSDHYVGMLSRWKPDGDFETIDPKITSQRVFSYVGEPTRPQYGYEDMLTEVVKYEPDLGFYIVGSSERYDNETIKKMQRAGKAIVRSFIPGPVAIEDSSVVLSHGGNGTIMLSLSLGKPVVCVGPYQSDCSSGFRFVEEQGAGVMLNHSKGPLERRLAPDLGEGVEIFGYWHSDITADQLHEAISRTMVDESFAVNARKLGCELVKMGGVVRAVDLIQEIAS